MALRDNGQNTRCAVAPLSRSPSAHAAGAVVPLSRSRRSMSGMCGVCGETPGRKAKSRRGHVDLGVDKCSSGRGFLCATSGLEPATRMNMTETYLGDLLLPGSPEQQHEEDAAAELNGGQKPWAREGVQGRLVVYVEDDVKCIPSKNICQLRHRRRATWSSRRRGRATKQQPSDSC